MTKGGQAGERSETERARTLANNKKHSDTMLLQRILRIAVFHSYPFAELALSVKAFGFASSPKGRALGKEVSSQKNQERIIRSFANSPPLAIWNFASRSET